MNPDICPHCRTAFQNLGHPMKPGVIVMRTCACKIVTESVGATTLTMIVPPTFSLHERIKHRREDEETAGSPMFLGTPDRWYEKPGPVFVCEDGHLADWVIKSEVNGDRCMTCRNPVLMTDPADPLCERPFPAV